MAKAHSPLRLEAQLVEQATLAGKQLHRSTAEQIEYWAELGRSLARTLSPDSLLQIHAGLARIRVEPVIGPTIDPESVFAQLEASRDSGELSDNLTHSSMRYQVSTTRPGKLEQIAPDGTVTVGQFQNGEFIPADEAGH